MKGLNSLQCAAVLTSQDDKNFYSVCGNRFHCTFEGNENLVMFDSVGSDKTAGGYV